MNDISVDDLNVLTEETLMNPEALKSMVPAPARAMETVSGGRLAIKKILIRQDPRLFLIVGPCSIHDTTAAMEYARRLKALSEEVDDSLLLVMRVYFEKPRTTTGWKGLVNDPHMDDSFCIAEGLKQGRELLVNIAELGLPTSTEALDPVTPQYLQDLISWSAIGARTTESQTHREMASGGVHRVCDFGDFVPRRPRKGKRHKVNHQGARKYSGFVRPVRHPEGIGGERGERDERHGERDG